MNVSQVDQRRIQEYNLEQKRLQEKRDEDYRKVIERRKFEDVVAERVTRNLRLELDKGRNIDIEC